MDVKSTKIRQILMQMSWIAAAEAPVQDALVAASRLLGLRRGEELIRHGQRVSHLAVIGSGAIESRRESREGGRHVLAVLSCGHALGYNPLFTDQPAASIDVALSPTEVVLVPREVLLQSMQRSPAVLLGVLQEMARRSGHLLQLIADPHLLSPTARVARTLLNLANCYSPATVQPQNASEVRLSQKTLGGLLGMPRQRVNGELRRLQTQGLIRLRYSVIALLDKDGLQALVSAEI